MPITWILSPWCYQYPIDAMVRSLKFAGERGQARLLGTLLAGHRAAVGRVLPQLVVPMPLHARRLRQRGYNQAGEIACFAARGLGLRAEPRALRRVRHTLPQTVLPLGERQANLRGAFAAARGLTGLRVALVDDVITTGSTAVAAATALADAGAIDIELWVLARVARRAHHSG